ncbi:MAG TPA: hypothetical protein VN698_03465 [Bacteroidia bacterium]|nr:hypothetical protein [Bacteroidia bacterium]
MKIKYDELIKTYNDRECVLDIDKVIKKWNSLFWIARWRDYDTNQFSYRLIVRWSKVARERCRIKCTIPENQAKELICKLNLLPFPSFFNSGTSFIKAEHAI